jgi:hypothetical protein
MRRRVLCDHLLVGICRGFLLESFAPVTIRDVFSFLLFSGFVACRSVGYLLLYCVFCLWLP